MKIITLFLLTCLVGACQYVEEDMKEKKNINNEPGIYGLQCIIDFYKKNKNGVYTTIGSKVFGDSSKNEIESIIQNFRKLNNFDWCIVYINKETSPEFMRKIINIFKNAKLNMKMVGTPDPKSNIKYEIMRHPTKGLFYRKVGPSSKFIKADPIPPFFPFRKVIFHIEEGKIIKDN